MRAASRAEHTRPASVTVTVRDSTATVVVDRCAGDRLRYFVHHNDLAGRRSTITAFYSSIVGRGAGPIVAISLLTLFISRDYSQRVGYRVVVPAVYGACRVSSVSASRQSPRMIASDQQTMSETESEPDKTARLPSALKLGLTLAVRRFARASRLAPVQGERQGNTGR